MRLIRLALPGSYCAAVHLLVRTPDKPKSSTNFGPAPCVLPGDGSNWVSFVHVADYAAAVASSIHSAVKGAAFNITAEPVRNGDYLDRLAQLLNVPVPPREPALPLPRSYRCSNTAAKAALGEDPRRTFGHSPPRASEASSGGAQTSVTAAGAERTVG